MLDFDSLNQLKEQVVERAKADQYLLEQLRSEIRPLKGEVKVIRQRPMTAVSLVASDGGNNKLAFDPFYFQLVRVTDSYGKLQFLDVVSPSTDTDELSRRQFDSRGNPRTALGRMMADMKIERLHDLSHIIPLADKIRRTPDKVSPGWVLVYRDLCEWAVLYDSVVHGQFQSDTILVRDGLLRSKIFNGNLFIRILGRVEERIKEIERNDKRRVFLVGVAKHSKVIDRYNLAMALENIFSPGEPKYVRVPRDLEAKAYLWEEYARGSDWTEDTKEDTKFVAGMMHLVRFGQMSGDPLWPVDILSGQIENASEILGYLLNDSVEGFPIPYYPLCLQRAHEHAQIVDFDLVIFQDTIFDAIKEMLPSQKAEVVDALRLYSDVSGRRYG